MFIYCTTNHAVLSLCDMLSAGRSDELYLPLHILCVCMCGLLEPCLPKKTKSTRAPWSAQEKAALVTTFKEHLTTRRAPSKFECQQLLSSHANVFHPSRDYKKIYFYVKWLNVKAKDSCKKWDCLLLWRHYNSSSVLVQSHSEAGLEYLRWWWLSDKIIVMIITTATIIIFLVNRHHYHIDHVTKRGLGIGGMANSPNFSLPRHISHA